MHIHDIDFSIVYSTLFRGGCARGAVGGAAAFAATIWKIETPTAKYIRRQRLEAVKQNIYTHKRLARQTRQAKAAANKRVGKMAGEERKEM